MILERGFLDTAQNRCICLPGFELAVAVVQQKDDGYDHSDTANQQQRIVAVYVSVDQFAAEVH